MLSKKEVHTNAKALGPYSQGIKSGSFLFTSGQVALDHLTGDLVAGGIAEQTRQALVNLNSVLTAGGATWNNLVKTTIFLVNMDDFPIVNQIYSEVLHTCEIKPARSTVAVSRLPKNALVEIEGIAIVNELN